MLIVILRNSDVLRGYMRLPVSLVLMVPCDFYRLSVRYGDSGHVLDRFWRDQELCSHLSSDRSTLLFLANALL